MVKGIYCKKGGLQNDINMIKWNQFKRLIPIEEESIMENRKMKYHFEADVLEKMNEFERDFLGDSYKKDTSENKGPNYKEKMAQDDADAFEEYLESEYAEDFLKLS